MRNKLACTAQKLSQIQPEMIQSLVGPQVFQLGKEYHSANCVQVLESHEDQILSEVTGPFGLYEQAIQLKGGHLFTQCSCTSNEPPFCRHCVAVLLAYQSAGSARDLNGFPEASVSVESLEDEDIMTSPLSVNLHQVSVLIEWLQRATRALDREHALPEAPGLDQGDVMVWIRAVQNLHARWRVSEEKRLMAEAELLKRDGHLETLLKKLEALPREATAGQTACEGMQHTILSCKMMLSRLSDMAEQRDRIEEQLRSTAEDLLQKGVELNSVFGSLKEVSSGIQDASASTVH
jgi:hypothetical protein